MSRGVKLIITRKEGYDYAEQIVQNIPKALLLTTDKLECIVKQPVDYKGYTFVVMAEDISNRRGASTYTQAVAQLVKVWRHMDATVIIVATEKSTPLSLEGWLRTIDKCIRSFITKAIIDIEG